MKKQERIWLWCMEIAIKNYSVYKKLSKAIITSPFTSRVQSLVHLFIQDIIISSGVYSKTLLLIIHLSSYLCEIDLLILAPIYKNGKVKYVRSNQSIGMKSNYFTSLDIKILKD